jgi:hypothetical protein
MSLPPCFLLVSVPLFSDLVVPPPPRLTLFRGKRLVRVSRPVSTVVFGLLCPNTRESLWIILQATPIPLVDLPLSLRVRKASLSLMNRRLSTPLLGRHERGPTFFTAFRTGAPLFDVVVVRMLLMMESHSLASACSFFWTHFATTGAK